jgi:hypothetical protein
VQLVRVTESISPDYGLLRHRKGLEAFNQHVRQMQIETPGNAGYLILVFVRERVPEISENHFPAVANDMIDNNRQEIGKKVKEPERYEAKNNYEYPEYQINNIIHRTG